MENKILIGTSGWSYDEWVGPFYPKGLDRADFLTYYAQIYNTNEINTTFYQIPSAWIVKNWVNRTPSDFIFTAKLPRTITHEAKLDVNQCLEELDLYLKVMSPLIESEKILSFLIQLPPSFKKSEHFGNLREFISNWPVDWKSQGYQLTVEFRHESWMKTEVFSYLTKEEITYCAVIEPKLPPRMDVTNPDLAYIRFHGYGEKIWFDYEFKEAEIQKWASKIQPVIPKARVIGIYFNNHFSGYATKNSLLMMGELGIVPRKEPSDINVLDIKRKAGTCDPGQKSLEDFF